VTITEHSDFEIAPGYDGFASLPEGGEHLGLLLLPEMFGITPAMQDAARTFAQAGFATLIPNVFRRAADSRPIGYDGANHKRAQDRADALDLAGIYEDIAIAIDAFRTKVPGIRNLAALGHCIGGTFAVTALTKTDLVGAISYYGFGLSKLGTLAHLGKPAQLHYGLADPHIPVEEVNAVTALAGGNPNVTIFEYPNAGHSFCNPNRPMYDKAQAQMAHERTLFLLRSLCRTK
jgi:carboxymethylenebutenolidase